ncbi:MAG: EAL domain-containing protein [Sulfuricurvum sp.]|nr:EAL domain-containing protein [Sulfuricurvum sp.]
MSRFSNARLSTKIIMTLLIGGSLIFAVSTLATYWIVRGLTMNTQKEKASLLIQSVEPFVAITLFLGIKEIEDKVSSITRLHEVVALEVTDIKGVVIYNYRKNSSNSLVKTIKITKSIMEPSSLKSIGAITLTYSGEEFTKTMYHFYTLYGLIIMGAILTLWLTLIWINRLLLPIKLIAHKVHNFRPGEKVIFDIPYAQYEFVQIIKAFESMQQRVWDYAQKFQTINQDLEIKVKNKTHELIQSLYRDTLTSLPNRLKLQEDLLLSPTNTVAIFNIDDFKEVNDFFGIDAGDDLLGQIAYWLSETKLQPYRIGGDEFAFILPREFSHEQIDHTIISLLSNFEERNFIIGEESFHLRGTAGVAIMSKKPIIHADIALNKARSIKKSYSLYDSTEGIEDQYKSNIAMSAQIRQALIEHRIVCQYQPIVNCKTGVTDKYETLVRIQRDDGTLIPPNDFLPIAKKTKLYSSITQEVIYQACHTFSNRTEHFSINLSNSDILDPHTLTTIERILKQTNTANRIVFEILESEGIENFDEVALFITRMKELGASIAIDDFGSGYSNFENILKLNVDFLKIDGSLIKTIDQNPRHRIVVESIVDFAHRIGIETIAEFVATEDIHSIVRELGITYSQGYHTGKPMSL